MRWKNSSTFVTTVLLSVIYFFLTLLNYIAPLNPHIEYVKSSMLHVWVCIAYFTIALLISWGVYFFLHRPKQREKAFFTIMVVGIILVLVGVFLSNIIY